MLMMCWFYCIPFAKGLFFATAPLLVLFGLFMLKRGVRQMRPQLRQGAFLLMFIAALKFFMMDLYLLRHKLLCGVGSSYCTPVGFKFLQVLTIAALLATSALLLYRYRDYIREERRLDITPEQVHLPLWAGASMTFVGLLAVWLVAPWVGYLTVGHVPAFVLHVPWQHLAVINVALLVIGFWKLEDCSWIYSPAEKTKKQHLHRVWTPKDTLGLSAILFVLALIFSYVSQDVLTNPTTKAAVPLDLDKIDFSILNQRGFKMPADSH